VGKRLVLAVAVVAMASAGCTTSASGLPTPAPGGDSSNTSTPSESNGPTSPSVDLPPRPRDIALDGLDPCTLFTDVQRSQLKVDDVDSGVSDSQNFNGMKECTLSVQAQEPFYEYTALAVTTEGIEEWLGGNRNVDAEPTTVQGFPAAQFKFLGVEDEGCDIAVGVGDKQYLWLQVIPISRGFKQDQLCQMVGQATDMAMTTLQALK
jgi:hypothetical protein